MAETPSQTPARLSFSEEEDEEEYWCHHCDKRVAVETVGNFPDLICQECKYGFVESFVDPDPDPPQYDDAATAVSAADPQFMHVLRLLAMTARTDDAPPPVSQNPNPDDNDAFLRIEPDGWDNDDDEEDDDRSVEFDGNEENEEEAEAEEENRSDREDESEEDMRRRRRETLRLRIRDIATRARSGRNRILDWAEILMGLEDNSIELGFDVPESDRYVGNPEDYVDAAGYEALLQTFAESDSSGRRGAPPASKAAVAELPTVEIMSADEALVCAICKDMVSAGEMSKKLPCGHGYHGDCIVPWLSTRNSCPVCRFELPTDDPEYEEERKKRGGPVNVSAGASGSGWR